MSLSRNITYKTFLILIVCGPLVAAVILGYPVRVRSDRRDTSLSRLSRSVRCFKTGELQQMFTCSPSHTAISGKELVQRVNAEVGSLYPFFHILLDAAIGVATVMAILFVM